MIAIVSAWLMLILIFDGSSFFQEIKLEDIEKPYEITFSIE